MAHVHEEVFADASEALDLTRLFLSQPLKRFFVALENRVHASQQIDSRY